MYIKYDYSCKITTIPNSITFIKCTLSGWYGVSGCVFSLPVRFTDGSYQVVWDMELDNDRKDALKKLEAELKKVIFHCV